MGYNTKQYQFMYDTDSASHPSQKWFSCTTLFANIASHLSKRKVRVRNATSPAPPRNRLTLSYKGCVVGVPSLPSLSSFTSTPRQVNLLVHRLRIRSLRPGSSYSASSLPLRSEPRVFAAQATLRGRTYF